MRNSLADLSLRRLSLADSSRSAIGRRFAARLPAHPDGQQARQSAASICSNRRATTALAALDP